jgi:uncharacterized protein YjbI with pentapeptide repeats
MTRQAERQAIDWRVPRLAGKRLVFAGNARRSGAAELARNEAAEVLPQVTAEVDFLVVERYAGSAPTGAEKKADKLIHKGAPIKIIGLEDFCKLFLPSREEALAMLTAGEEGVRRWQQLAGQYWARGQVDLRKAKLRGARLNGARLHTAMLDGADLRDANLEWAYLENLDGVRLDNARLCTHAGLYHLKNCSLKGADLTDANIGDAADCNLDGAKLVKARVGPLIRCSLRKADLGEAHLNGAGLEKSDLAGAILRKVTGWGCKASEAVFRGADLTDALLQHASFPKADFTKAILDGACLEEADLSGAKLAGTRLVKTDLTRAKLIGADLTRADLSHANLAGADLTDAIIDGADFTGANLAGAILTHLDLAKARGIDSAHRASGAAGPQVKALEAAVAQAASFAMKAVIDLDPPVTIRLTTRRWDTWTSITAYTWVGGQRHMSHSQSLSDTLLELAQRWAASPLRLESLEIKSSKCPLGHRELRELAVAAWCEARGEAVPSAAELRTRQAARRSAQDETRAALVAMLRGGAKGIERWNALQPHERKAAGHFREVDLSGADLTGADLHRLDFEGANFAGAILRDACLDRGWFSEANLEKACLEKARMSQAAFRRANFRGANLTEAGASGAHFHGADLTNAALNRAQLSFCSLRGATLQGADLREAYLDYADLRQADLSTARLQGTTLEDTRYDEQTRFPAGFTPPAKMKWAGSGPRPGPPTAPPSPANGPKDFEQFLGSLKEQVDPARLDKALQMLKAERFQLFADIDTNALVGVVKSQGDARLVYSCRLAQDGSFACCTQDLITCGGLKGRVCKHILVLVLGLTRTARIDLGTALGLVTVSNQHRQKIDKDVMSDTFLRYKGAEAGTIDWRPTETIPEDYYAL